MSHSESQSLVSPHVCMPVFFLALPFLLSLSLTRTQSLSCARSFMSALCFARAHSRVLSLTFSLSRCLSRSHSPALALSLSFSLPLGAKDETWRDHMPSAGSRKCFKKNGVSSPTTSSSINGFNRRVSSLIKIQFRKKNPSI